jgi:hypothetical protein
MKKNIWKSVGALFAGAVVTVALSVGTDMLLQKAGVFPALGQVMSNPLLLLAAAYRPMYGVLGSCVAANWPMMHALMLGAWRDWR